MPVSFHVLVDLLISVFTGGLRSTNEHRVSVCYSITLNVLFHLITIYDKMPSLATQRKYRFILYQNIPNGLQIYIMSNLLMS